jgi:type 1 fimbria pilin
MLKKFIFSLTAIMALSLVVMAQDKADKADKAKEVKLTGAIVDQHCAAADMATHKRGCVVSAACLKSGLGIFENGHFTAFDADGSAKAKEALEKSKKDSGAKFEVTGTVTDGKMTVKAIKEVV